MRPATLVCLPHAGGTASGYRSWHDRIPGWSVSAVTLPGRERLFAEPFLRSVEAMAKFAAALIPPGQVALFGHSLGALVAYELALALEGSGRPVRGLVVAGHGPPDAPPRGRPLHALPEAALLAELRSLGGLDPELEGEPELLELVLPRIRADLEAAERYRTAGGRTLRCPLLVLGGRDDAGVPEAELQGWVGTTAGDASVRILDGNHFFVHDDAPAVQRAIAAFLGDP